LALRGLLLFQGGKEEATFKNWPNGRLRKLDFGALGRIGFIPLGRPQLRLRKKETRN